MRYVLEQVVAEGSGRKAAVEGFSIEEKRLLKITQKQKKIYFFFFRLCPGK